MDSSRWERIQELFHEAALLPDTAAQRAFLESSCSGEPSLVEDVVALLKEDAHSNSLLDQPFAEVAHSVLSDERNSLPFPELGSYRIHSVLGEGGMGVVYLAERQDLGGLVALKLLRDASLSPARRERFAAEQRTLAQLNHPSIARLYDADTLADGTPFFVMEYVEGLPLTDYCVAHHCSIERRLQLFRQVCEAVQYAHGNAVIHRDLKPSNILVKADGTIRLLDFGIAKQLESLDVPAHQTMTALRLMTPAYASPEQIRGQRVGIQTDVYSLGVILYELLSGDLPFDLSNLSPAEAEMVLVSHEAPRPSVKVARQTKPADSLVGALSASARADLDVLCLTAMHKDPERRYRSVEALARDVDHYLQGEPLEARPDALSYRLGKFVRRNRREVLAASTAAALLVGLIIFFTLRLEKARDAALAEAARTQRIQHFTMNLFQGGDEEVGPAEDLRVITLVGRGVQEAQALTGDPTVQAELYETLGTVYGNLGKFDEAEKLLNSSLEQRKTRFGADSAPVAETLIALAGLRDSQAKFADAEQLARQGIDMSKRHLPPNHPAIGKATALLGKVLEDRGQYEPAIAVLEEAARLQSAALVPTNELSGTLTELANCHFYAGHYDKSEVLNQRLLAMDRQFYGERHPHVADDLINLGAIQYERTRYSESERYYREGLDITESFYGKDHPATASALTMLGRGLLSQGKLDEAATTLQEALRIQEKVYGKVHPRVAGTLNELGKISQHRGKLDEAEAELSRTVDIYRTIYSGKHYYIGVALSNLAGVLVDKKEYSRAEQLFHEALQMYSQTLAPDHQLVGIAHARLGRALLRERRFAEAESESRTGYDILTKQSNPPVVWIQFARTDLSEVYDVLHQPEKASRFRAELAANETKPSETARKN
ncbi:MAG: tetratricopeptide repeat protein [Acidobacteria bacterium]|nr:tetratricopeptide repeat protein [Acidobacteriota bacterium]